MWIQNPEQERFVFPDKAPGALWTQRSLNLPHHYRPGNFSLLLYILQLISPRLKTHCISSLFGMLIYGILSSFNPRAETRELISALVFKTLRALWTHFRAHANCNNLCRCRNECERKKLRQPDAVWKIASLTGFLLISLVWWKTIHKFYDEIVLINDKRQLGNYSWHS